MQCNPLLRKGGQPLLLSALFLAAQFSTPPVFANNGKNTVFYHKKKQLTAERQERISVSGQVRDASGKSIAGVSARARGTSAATSTDENGRYEIQ